MTIANLEAFHVPDIEPENLPRVRFVHYGNFATMKAKQAKLMVEYKSCLKNLMLNDSIHPTTMFGNLAQASLHTPKPTKTCQPVESPPANVIFGAVRTPTIAMVYHPVAPPSPSTGHRHAGSPTTDPRIAWVIGGAPLLLSTAPAAPHDTLTASACDIVITEIKKKFKDDVVKDLDTGHEEASNTQVKMTKLGLLGYQGTLVSIRLPRNFGQHSDTQYWGQP